MNNNFQFPVHMSWDFLKRFHVIVNSTSFSEAARRVGTSSSALLTQLDQLEAELGRPLFRRVNKNRSKVLTEEGEVLRQTTQKVFDFLSLPMEEQLKTTAKPRLLKVITTHRLATSFLNEPITQYLKLNPDIQLQMTTHAPPDYIQQGEVAIRSKFLEQKSLKKEFLLVHKFRLAAAKEYLDQYGRPERPEDLQKHKLLMLTANGGNAALKWALGMDVKLVPHVTSDSFDFIIQQCKQGAGICELADSYDMAGLEEVLPRVTLAHRDIYIGYNKRSENDELMKNFVRFLQSYIGQNSR